MLLTQVIHPNEQPFNTPAGPVFNPGVGFGGNRGNTGYVNSPAEYGNGGQGFASSAALNMGPVNGGLGGSLNNNMQLNLGQVASGGNNPYHSVYSMSPNNIPLGPGRPLLNSGMGF